MRDSGILLSIFHLTFLLNKGSIDKKAYVQHVEILSIGNEKAVWINLRLENAQASNIPGLLLAKNDRSFAQTEKQ